MAAVSFSSLDCLVQSVPKKDAPIREIPKYIFENCNQATCNNYPDSFFKLFRGRVGDMGHFSVAQTTDMKMGKVTEQKAEEIDWIYGLNQVEKELLQASKVESELSVESIMRINGYFSRIISGKETGKMREKGIHWPFSDGDEKDTIFMQICTSIVHSRYGGSIVENPESFRGNNCPLKRTRATNFFRALQNHPPVLLNFITGKPASEEEGEAFRKITPQDIGQCYDKALVQQGKKLGATLNAIQHLFYNYHFFPPPKEIPKELEASIAYVQNDANHPIMKACRIWYDIVRIHISHEANKRSGKAIGSAILLSYGYLPPKIGKEHSREYVTVMREGFAKGEEGFENFVRFIVERMRETWETEGAREE